MENRWRRFSPFIRHAEDSYIDTKRSILNRTIFDFELLFVKEGNIRVTFTGHAYDGKPGDLFFLRPGITHSIHFLSLPYVHQPHIHFDFFEDENSAAIPVSLKPLSAFTPYERALIRPDDTQSLPVGIPTYIKLHDADVFEKMLFELIHGAELESPFHNLQMKSLFSQLWVYLLHELQYMKNPGLHSGLRIASQVREYLIRNTHAQLTLDELAKRFNVSKFHLVKMFSSCYGESPMRFHTRKRLDVARTFLRNTDMTVAEISSKTGFHSIYSFSRAFRAYVGQAPRDYRKFGAD